MVGASLSLSPFNNTTTHVVNVSEALPVVLDQGHHLFQLLALVLGHLHVPVQCCGGGGMGWVGLGPMSIYAHMCGGLAAKVRTGMQLLEPRVTGRVGALHHPQELLVPRLDVVHLATELPVQYSGWVRSGSSCRVPSMRITSSPSSRVRPSTHPGIMHNPRFFPAGLLPAQQPALWHLQPPTHACTRDKGTYSRAA